MTDTDRQRREAEEAEQERFDELRGLEHIRPLTPAEDAEIVAIALRWEAADAAQERAEWLANGTEEPHFIRDTEARAVARANATADAIAELGEPGTDFPRFVTIQEQSVYEVALNPGFPCSGVAVSVNMTKKMDDGQDFRDEDTQSPYTVNQFTDGHFECDCKGWWRHKSKKKDQRKPDSFCKHIAKLVEEGIFQTK